MDQSRNRESKTRRTIPGQPGEDEYDYKQGQRGRPGVEGSSRPGDPRVQQSSHRPDPRPHSITRPMVQDRHDYFNQEDSSSKGDKYSRKPQKDMFNPYSSSNHQTDPRLLSEYSPSQLWGEEESSDDSNSSSGGSGSETAAPTPRPSIRGRKIYNTRPKAPSMPTRPSLDTHRGLSDPSGISKSKSHQPSVAEPSSYTGKESAPVPVQRSFSRDPRGGRDADTDFTVGSYRGDGPSGMSRTMSQQPWGVGQPVTSDDSQSRSGHKEKERDRSSTQQSSSRADPRSRRTDDYVAGGQGLVGGYRVEGGGPGHPSDSQTHSGYKEETTRSSVQQSSSRQDPRARGIDGNYVAGGQGLVGGYRVEGGGGPGHPSDSQTRSGYKEKESARLPVQQSSSRDPVMGSYRSDGPSGLSKTMLQQPWVGGQPAASGDSQSRSSRKDQSSTQQSSSYQDPRSRGTDDDYGIGGQGLVGSYRGDGLSGHPSDSQTRSGYKEKEIARLPVQQSSSRDPVVGSYRSEVGGGPSGMPKTMSQQPWGVGQPAASGDSQTRSGTKEQEKDRSSTQQSSSHPDPRMMGPDDDYVFGRTGSVEGYRGEVGGRISGHPSDSQTHSGYKEKEGGSSVYSRNIPFTGRDHRASIIPTETMDTTAHSSRPPNPMTSLGGQAISGSLSRIPYTERDRRTSIISTEIMDTTAHSSRSPPTTSAGGQAMSSGLSSIHYTERDRRAPIIPTEIMDTTAHSSRPPPNPTTSAGGQAISGGSSRILYTERDRRASIIPTETMETTAHSSRSPPNPTTSIYGPNSSTDTARSPQHDARYLHPSQVQDSFTRSSQPTAPPSGWSANPTHRMFFSSLH